MVKAGVELDNVVEIAVEDEEIVQSSWLMRSLTRLMIKSSETRPPLSITLLAIRPSSVPALTAARSERGVLASLIAGAY